MGLSVNNLAPYASAELLDWLLEGGRGGKVGCGEAGAPVGAGGAALASFLAPAPSLPGAKLPSMGMDSLAALFSEAGVCGRGGAGGGGRGAGVSESRKETHSRRATRTRAPAACALTIFTFRPSSPSLPPPRHHRPAAHALLL